MIQNIVCQDSRTFTDPGGLECEMQSSVGAIPPYMGCCNTNLIVGVPANRVQETCINKAGATHEYTLEFLNDQYLDGYKIDLDAIDFSDIIGCQQELEMSFIKRNS